MQDNNGYLIHCIIVALGAFYASIALAQPESDALVRCNFRPQARECESFWRTEKISSPAVESVKAAYQSYGKYLRAPATSLTEEDHSYLSRAGIRMPQNLTAENLSGLHYVINDPEYRTNENARRLAVNGFLTRAVQAELYCAFNKCDA